MNSKSMIWTSDQMRKIQTKNMRTVHDNKKNALILIKKFHEDYFSQSVSIKWAKNKNKQSFSDKQILNSTRAKKNTKLTEITTSILIETQIQNST